MYGQLKFRAVIDTTILSNVSRRTLSRDLEKTCVMSLFVKRSHIFNAEYFKGREGGGCEGGL